LLKLRDQQSSAGLSSDDVEDEMGPEDHICVALMSGTRASARLLRKGVLACGSTGRGAAGSASISVGERLLALVTRLFSSARKVAKRLTVICGRGGLEGSLPRPFASLGESLSKELSPTVQQFITHVGLEVEMSVLHSSVSITAYTYVSYVL